MIAKINIPIDVTIELANGFYTIKADIHDVNSAEDTLERAIEEFKISFHEYVAQLEIDKEDWIEDKIELNRLKNK